MKKTIVLEINPHLLEFLKHYSFDYKINPTSEKIELYVDKSINENNIFNLGMLFKTWLINNANKIM